jgi:hypothetical protein
MQIGCWPLAVARGGFGAEDPRATRPLGLRVGHSRAGHALATTPCVRRETRCVDSKQLCSEAAGLLRAGTARADRCEREKTDRSQA